MTTNDRHKAGTNPLDSASPYSSSNAAAAAATLARWLVIGAALIAGAYTLGPCGIVAAAALAATLIARSTP